MRTRPSPSSTSSRLQRAARAALVAAALGVAVGAQAEDPLRPEVGKPLQAAQELLKKQQYREALNKIREAEAVGNRTANENFVIERMRASAAAGAGDNETAARSFEALINSGKLSQGDQLKYVEALSGIYFRARDYANAAKWATRAVKEGAGPATRQLAINSMYLAGDMAGAQRELNAQIKASEAAGTAPTEEQLQLLANIAAKQNDKGAYANALEQLVTYYPKKEYWSDLVQRVSSRPNFSDRLSLFVYRLKLARGQITSAADYMEASQLAMQAGYPGEAKKIVEQGYTAGVLGAGAEADRQKRLRDMVSKASADDDKGAAKNEAEARAAKDGQALVSFGYYLVTAGQADKGTKLMEEGIAKGGLKRPDDAKLLLGIAYLQAGQKAKAQATFKTVQGADGSADLARLWALHAKQAA